MMYPSFEFAAASCPSSLGYIEDVYNSYSMKLPVLSDMDLIILDLF